MRELADHWICTVAECRELLSKAEPAHSRVHRQAVLALAIVISAIMFIEIIAIVGVVLANVICYACHENSILRYKWRGPRLLFISNR